MFNAGRAEAAGCWVTRSQAGQLVERSREYLSATSALVARAAGDQRQEVAALEREAAVAATQGNLSHTPTALLRTLADAPLATRIQLARQGEAFRLEFFDQRGGHAAGSCSRTELQGVLDMLERQVAAAGWTSPAPAATPATPPRSRLN